ncbi:hypothetical protein HETIRDRAFT_475996 [Heterobasidion irregulare TC 32-1]|uniref:BTB domain-containing protein n=1 Tax=Heterobasidion irregulare (strain TC 32-1) TaxID=747525 RepID=W4K4W3_HETIT|nr:uncharacterized protein HETIRDRAFT_475996 [Heterobasidion irregulare TC 32-1]ETW80405.1 hypothetical protein HETIRDRAFT_475996 [Heterobasidion irregulare TC 32-1]
MSTTTPEPTLITTFKAADPPFDDTDADIVLRSSDNVDFYVHKWPLSRASSVFKDMFSIPSSYDSFNADNVKDGLPVVRVTEDRQTLDIVLRLCYPRDQQTLTLDVPSIRQLLPALEKYEMLKDMTGILKPMMLAAAKTDSRAMYAIACRYQMLKLANRIAVLSRRLLSDVSFPSTIDFFSKGDLQSISGHHLCQFLMFHQQSSSAASRAVRSDWSVFAMFSRSVSQNPPCYCSQVDFATTKGAFHGPEWLLTYCKQCEENLRSRPHCEVVMEKELITDMCVAAAQCDACRPRARRIHTFCKKMMGGVRRALESVPLPFPEAESKE